MGVLNKFHGKNTVIKGGMKLEGQVTLKQMSGNPLAAWGVTRVGCGVATVVVSTSLVNSDSWFSLTPVYRGPINTNSVTAIVVNSISSGVNFAIAWANGMNVFQVPVDVCWEVRKVS